MHDSIPDKAVRTGRVAAGAIAEKYLKQVHGIEIVAFVSSVGKIHLPSNVAPPSMKPDADEDNDDVEDALSPEFRQLLSTITREQVDKHPTRCPHPETAERMTKVGHRAKYCIPDCLISLHRLFLDRPAHYPR